MRFSLHMKVSYGWFIILVKKPNMQSFNKDTMAKKLFFHE